MRLKRNRADPVSFVVQVLVSQAYYLVTFGPAATTDYPSSTGHQGMHGHEFLEFEYSHGESDHSLPEHTSKSCKEAQERKVEMGLIESGRIRYANNSNYRNDSLIRKESEYQL